MMAMYFKLNWVAFAGGLVLYDLHLNICLLQITNHYFYYIQYSN